MREGWRDRLGRGALALLAVAIVVAVLLTVLPEPSAIILGIALTASLSRSQFERDRRGRLEALALLPVVGLAGVALGALLRASPWIGALVYVVVLVAVVASRGRGPFWRRIGSLVATPFLAVLFLPAGVGVDLGPLAAVLAPIGIAVLAWVVVTAVQGAARALMLIPRPVSGGREDVLPPSRLRPSASTRSALQLGVALTVAFVVGGTVFGEHWPWVVLSTIIVAYLPRGRADAIRTGVHRLIGAAVGSLVALLPAGVLPSDGGVVVALALTAIGVGVLFREIGYAVWAFGVTVALTLLERLTGQPSPLIGQRLIEIVVGVAIGLLAVALVYPVRTADVVRSRLSAVLAAVSDRLAAADATDARAAESRIRAALRELDRSAAALTDAARVLALVHRPPPRAAAWTSDAHLIAAVALTAPTPGPAARRRAVGAARRALRSPDDLGPALRRAVEAG
ncbi:MAG: FUSC family protein [Microbacterium enclense]